MKSMHLFGTFYPFGMLPVVSLIWIIVNKVFLVSFGLAQHYRKKYITLRNNCGFGLFIAKVSSIRRLMQNCPNPAEKLCRF